MVSSLPINRTGSCTQVFECYSSIVSTVWSSSPHSLVSGHCQSITDSSNPPEPFAWVYPLPSNGCSGAKVSAYPNGVTHPSCIQLGIQKNSNNNKTILHYSPIYKIRGLSAPFKLVPFSPEGAKVCSTLVLICNQTSPTIPNYKAQTLAQTSQRWLTGSIRVTVIPRVLSPGWMLGEGWK